MRLWGWWTANPLALIHWALHAQVRILSSSFCFPQCNALKGNFPWLEVQDLSRGLLKYSGFPEILYYFLDYATCWYKWKLWQDNSTWWVGKPVRPSNSNQVSRARRLTGDFLSSVQTTVGRMKAHDWVSACQGQTNGFHHQLYVSGLRKSCFWAAIIGPRRARLDTLSQQRAALWVECCYAQSQPVLLLEYLKCLDSGLRRSGVASGTQPVRGPPFEQARLQVSLV